MPPAASGSRMREWESLVPIMVGARRRAQARVDVASRPDYNGPYIPLPALPADDARPRMRTSPVPVGPVGPITEPALPTIDPLQDLLGNKGRPSDQLLPAPTMPLIPSPAPDVPKPDPEPSKKPK